MTGAVPECGPQHPVGSRGRPGAGRRGLPEGRTSRRLHRTPVRCMIAAATLASRQGKRRPEPDRRRGCDCVGVVFGKERGNAELRRSKAGGPGRNAGARRMDRRAWWREKARSRRSASSLRFARTLFGLVVGFAHPLSGAVARRRWCYRR
jgi:hypothetical protein